MRKSDVYKLKTVEGDCGPEYHIVPKDAPEDVEPKEKSHNPATAQRRLLYWNALETAND